MPEKRKKVHSEEYSPLHPFNLFPSSEHLSPNDDYRALASQSETWPNKRRLVEETSPSQNPQTYTEREEENFSTLADRGDTPSDFDPHQGRTGHELGCTNFARSPSPGLGGSMLYSLPPPPKWPPPDSEYAPALSYKIIYDPSLDTPARAKHLNSLGLATRDPTYYRALIEHLLTYFDPCDEPRRVRIKKGGKSNGQAFLVRYAGEVCPRVDVDMDSQDQRGEGAEKDVIEEEIVPADPRRVEPGKTAWERNKKNVRKELGVIDQYEHEPEDSTSSSHVLARRVLITGIPPTVPASVLKEHYGTFGSLTSFNWHLDPENGSPLGVLYLEFSDADQAKRCVQAEDGRISTFPGTIMGTELVNPPGLTLQEPRLRAVLDQDGVVLGWVLGLLLMETIEERNRELDEELQRIQEEQTRWQEACIYAEERRATYETRVEDLRLKQREQEKWVVQSLKWLAEQTEWVAGTETIVRLRDEMMERRRRSTSRNSSIRGSPFPQGQPGSSLDLQDNATLATLDHTSTQPAGLAEAALAEQQPTTQIPQVDATTEADEPPCTCQCRIHSGVRIPSYGIGRSRVKSEIKREDDLLWVRSIKQEFGDVVSEDGVEPFTEEEERRYREYPELFEHTPPV